jgi:hypothetical protein
VKANLPTVPIYEISIHPRENDLILATHGRSIWILDDLTPIQEYSKATASAAHLFAPPAAVQKNAAGDRSRDFEGDQIFLGENPARGVVLTYRLAADAKEVAIELTDAGGAVVRKLEGDDMKEKNKAGLHPVTWDLRLSPLPEVKGQESQNRFGPGTNGPFVTPGLYRARLLVDGKEAASSEIRVSGDPDVVITESERARYDESARRAYDLNRRANEAANAVVGLHERFEEAKKSLEKTDLPEDLSAKWKDLESGIQDLRRRFGVGRREAGPPAEDDVRGEISRLRGSLLGATAVPTEAQGRLLVRLADDLSKATSDVNATLGKLSEVYRELAARGLYPSVPKPVS